MQHEFSIKDETFKYWYFSILKFQELCYRLKIKAFHIHVMAVLFIYLLNKDLYEKHILQCYNHTHIFSVCMIARSHHII